MESDSKNLTGKFINCASIISKLMLSKLSSYVLSMRMQTLKMVFQPYYTPIKL
jgi:hypothetical protein